MMALPTASRAPSRLALDVSPSTSFNRSLRRQSDRFVTYRLRLAFHHDPAMSAGPLIADPRSAANAPPPAISTWSAGGDPADGRRVLIPGCVSAALRHIGCQAHPLGRLGLIDLDSVCLGTRKPETPTTCSLHPRTTDQSGPDAVKKTLQRMCKRKSLSIEGVGPHDLRRTVGTTMRKLGISVEDRGYPKAQDERTTIDGEYHVSRECVACDRAPNPTREAFIELISYKPKEAPATPQHLGSCRLTR
jgi:hypothetical protein